MSTATKLTYDDYVLMPDDGQRDELIDGELFVVPSPNTPHQFALGNIFVALQIYLLREAGGRVALAPLDVILSPVDVVQPDIVFVSDRNASRIEKRGIAGAPDLVIEILSGSTKRRDEVTKRALYERFAVPEYWIVDPDAKTVKVLRLAGSRYETTAELGDGDTLTSPMFPRFELSLATIFA